MKRNVTVLAVGGLGAILLLSGSALGSALPVGHARLKCNVAHSLTLASNSVARVYGTAPDTAFACLKATGKSRVLSGASASTDLFALSGGWVAWTSTDHTSVTVMRAANGAIPNQFPFNTNDNVVKIVVKSDGAAAWAATPSGGGGSTYVQGLDRKNHPPDQFSDDTKFVRGTSLTSLAGHKIAWGYTDGSTASTSLF
jgi:hypothetical protein